jgi:hypothetical protein
MIQVILGTDGREILDDAWVVRIWTGPGLGLQFSDDIQLCLSNLEPAEFLDCLHNIVFHTGWKKMFQELQQCPAQAPFSLVC